MPGAHAVSASIHDSSAYRRLPFPASVRIHFIPLLAAAALIAPPATTTASPLDEDSLRTRLGVTQVSVQSLQPNADRGFAIDLDGRRVTLDLQRSALRRPWFRVLVQRADGSYREAQAPPAAAVRGTVREIPGSRVGGTIRNGRLTAALALPDGRLFYVQPIRDVEPSATPDRHAIYRAADAIGGDETCATTEADAIALPDAGGAVTATTVRVAELALDADWEFYTLNGSSVDATIEDIEDVMSAVNVVYERDCAITHELGTIIVRTTPTDPYSATNASTVLSEFRNHWNASQTGVTRDVAHLMTGKNLDGSTIGIAFIGAVCNRSSAYGVSQSRFTSNFSRRCALTAHELGHNWNARHCDDVTPCNIMCSAINGCEGIGLPHFEPMGVEAINSFAASRNCLETLELAVANQPQGRVRLAPPSPSPFSTRTTLTFHLEADGPVELDVYDVTGQRVVRLADGKHNAGTHQIAWHGRDDAGRLLKTGVYYARLRAGDVTQARKLILLR
jgi:hypothetical protein